MMWIRSRSLLLVLLVALAGCGGEESAPSPEPAPWDARHPLVRALADPDPAVRRHAAEDLGQQEKASPQVVRALLSAQDDTDPAVAEAALAALDRIHPDPDVALRVLSADCYGIVVEQVLIAHEHLTWRKVPCEPVPVPDATRRGACWMLAVVPAIYETQERRIMVRPDLYHWRDAEILQAGDVPMMQVSPPPPTPRRMEKQFPPQGEPEGAQAGEVWCWYETQMAPGGRWQRHPECEGPRSRTLTR